MIETNVVVPPSKKVHGEKACQFDRRHFSKLQKCLECGGISSKTRDPRFTEIDFCPTFQSPKGDNPIRN